MNKKQKIILVVSLVIFIPILIVMVKLYSVFTLFYNPIPNHIVEDYVEEKYNFDVKVVDTKNHGISSDTEFTVAKESEEHIQFTVTVDSFDNTIIQDDYELALGANKEYEKLITVIPAIEEMGFTGADGEPIRLSYVGESTFLYLESEKDVDYETFVEKELDTYYELYKLLKKSEANIADVTIAGPYNPSEEHNGIGFSIEEPAKERTKEQFLIDIKANHPEISARQVENRLEKEVDQLNNERFHFANEFPRENWLYCSTVDEKGDCTSAILSLTYQEGGLNSTNAFLSEDLTALFDFIETHLEPQIKVDTIEFRGADLSNEEFDVSYEERMKYKNVDELVDFILTKP